MAECQNIQRLLDAFIDNELASSEAAAVQSHIESCASCSTQLEDLLSLKRVLQEMPRPEVPPGLEHRVQRIAEEARSTRPRAWSARRWWLLSAGAATAAALVLLVVLGKGGLSSASKPMYASMIEDHRHLLSKSSKMDMMSDDREALWNWLRGKVSFSVPSSLVYRAELSLEGGRVIKEKGEETVSIKYKWEGQRTSLYAMKDGPPMPAGAEKIMVKGKPLYFDRYEGHNVMMWEEEGLFVCAVSTLARDKLIKMLMEVQAGRPLEV